MTEEVQQPENAPAAETDVESAPAVEETPSVGAEPAEPAAPVEPAAQAVPTEPEVVLPPKERRQRARAAKAAKVPANEPMTPEQRQAHRDAERLRKAKRRRVERARQRAKHAEAAHERVPTPPREHVPGRQKVQQGIVVSDKAEKTITVRIDVARRHRKYQKIVRTSTTLHAHDERNDANIGDTVVVRESRPLSRTKRWRLVEVVERAR